MVISIFSVLFELFIMIFVSFVRVFSIFSSFSCLFNCNYIAISLFRAAFVWWQRIYFYGFKKCENWILFFMQNRFFVWYAILKVNDFFVLLGRIMIFCLFDTFYTQFFFLIHFKNNLLKYTHHTEIEIQKLRIVIILWVNYFCYDTHEFVNSKISKIA